MLATASTATLLDELEMCARANTYGSHDTQRAMVREALLRRTTPRIDVVVVRHPDYENNVTTYVNGTPVEVHEWSFDPGAGYTYVDFVDMWDGDVNTAPSFLKPVLAKHYRELRRVFEKWSTDDDAWPASKHGTL
jgi:hypothetical protein